jgi:hypothetical protein
MKGEKVGRRIKKDILTLERWLTVTDRLEEKMDSFTSYAARLLFNFPNSVP